MQRQAGDAHMASGIFKKLVGTIHFSDSFKKLNALTVFML
jgi:hypothetical protein